jgi:hypothetical protein
MHIKTALNPVMEIISDLVYAWAFIKYPKRPNTLRSHIMVTITTTMLKMFLIL